MSPGNEDYDYQNWDRGNIRGLGRKRFVRVEKDVDGNNVNVYELDEDDEWAIRAVQPDPGPGQLEYVIDHRNHQNQGWEVIADCPICRSLGYTKNWRHLPYHGKD